MSGLSAEFSGFVALIIGPALFWALYHAYKDRHQPEPPLYLLLSYCLGLVGGWLAGAGYRMLDWFGLRFDAYALAQQDLNLLFLYAVLAIGTIEELAKFIPFYLIGIRHHHFDEPIDGIIYASFVALGFASYENAIYLSFLEGWEAVGRSIASPMVHVLFASIWGYACSRAQMRKQPIWPALIVGLGLAILLHGVYDFFAIGFPQLSIATTFLIGAIWIWRMHLIQALHLRHLRLRLVGRLRLLLQRRAGGRRRLSGSEDSDGG